jgi:hypothetical protein
VATGGRKQTCDSENPCVCAPKSFCFKQEGIPLNRSHAQGPRHTKATYYTKYKKIPLENQGEFIVKALFIIVL